MSLVLAALVTLSSTVAVRVEETDDVPVEAQRSVARALVRAIEESSGRWAVLDDPEWPSCGTSAACANIKAANIKLYTVRLINGDAALLSACATNTGMYYNVTSASQLNTVFASIAAQLTNLRLAQ